MEAKPSAQQLIRSDLSSELTPLQKIKAYVKESGGMKLHEVDPYCLNSKGLLTQEDLQTIREVTKGQSSNETWFQMRKGMMTASNFYRIKSRCNTLRSNPEASPEKLLKHLLSGGSGLGDHALPASLQWGRKREAKALYMYKTVMKKKHSRLRVESSGLSISTENYLVGASPDGICFCRCKHSNCRQMWLVEIKCAFATKYKSPKIAAKYNGCWFDKRSKKWKLDVNHRHYAQVQGLMGVLDCEHLDLVIYTTKGIVVIPVHFDQPFYDNLFSSLSYFHENYLFPFIINTIYKSRD